MPRALVSWLGRRPLPVSLIMGYLLTSCTSSPTALFQPQAGFPPQAVIDNADYQRFLADNQRRLAQCGGRTECAVTLYNLGFVYAYPESPYRDAQKARQYLNELRSRYPQSPWASQGRVLLTFMDEQVSLEEAQQRLRVTLRSRDGTIRKLRGQLQRSREIDLDFERKARELLR